MERAKKDLLNDRFRLALFDWQNHSGDPIVTRNINSLIREAMQNRGGLTIKVKPEILRRTESSRAISRPDLDRYFKRRGNDLVCNLRTSKGSFGDIQIGITDLWPVKRDRGIIDKFNFVMRKRDSKAWSTIAIFRPQEINSFEVA